MVGPYSIIEMLRDFVERVNALQIEYMVTGSFAMSAYGEIRTTRDIDIVVQIDERNVQPLTEAFGENYYLSDISIRRAIARRSMFNIVDNEHGAKIDCIVQKDNDFARESFGRRRMAKVSGVEFWTTTKEDLIVAKLNWARDSHSEMQIRDIANLTATEYDSEYVETWITSLGLKAIWAEVEKWKIQHLRSSN